MIKLNLLNTPERNNRILMDTFRSDVWTPDHLAARFSNTAVSAQRGYYQRLNGIVYIYAEICPDINNPYGGGATVSFIAGDVITLPIPTVYPQIYSPGDFLGDCSAVLTQLSNLAKFQQCSIRTNGATGFAEITINHTIPATASTFALEGIYIIKA